MFDALIQALTDGQKHFELDLQSRAAVQTDFVCVVRDVPRQKKKEKKKKKDKYEYVL